MADKDASFPRRGFLKLVNQLIAATGLAAVLGPLLAYFWPAKLEAVPSEPMAVGPVDSIALGESKTIKFGRYPALVINTPEKGFVAYSAVCTHFACIVKWNPDSGMIECPCHEAFFRPADGSVISGPPPRPLDEIPFFIQDNILFLGGEA